MNKKDLSPPLQHGAELLPQIETVKTGNWKPLPIDAECVKYGVRWLRVHGGFGGRFDREDWIADLPVSISVCDYHWNGSDFGPSYGSFEDACLARLEDDLRRARHQRAEGEARLVALASMIVTLESHVGSAPEWPKGGGDENRAAATPAQR